MPICQLIALVVGGRDYSINSHGFQPEVGIYEKLGSLISCHGIYAVDIIRPEHLIPDFSPNLHPIFELSRFLYTFVATKLVT